MRDAQALLGIERSLKDCQRAENIKTALTMAVCVALLVGLWVGGWVIVSRFEARAYNHVTGKNVSTWDAMFLDLRVQAEPKE